MQAGKMRLERRGPQCPILDPHRQKLHLAENAEPEEQAAA